jgi:hypothetical protein
MSKITAQRLAIVFLVAGLAFCPGTSAFAQDSSKLSRQERKAVMRDTLDGKFDFSRLLIDFKGFMPVPVIITEPALGGFGGVLALTFLKPKVPPPGVKYVPPDITSAFGMYTANGSWAAGGGRIGSFPKAGIKYRVLAGYAGLNLDFYRTFEQVGEQKFAFNIKTLPVLLNVSKNIGKTDLYLGAQYVFAKTQLAYRPDEPMPDWVPKEDIESNVAPLTMFFDWDRRDNFFTANKGTRLNVQYAIDDNWTGSDYDYQRLHGMFTWFFDPKPTWISGLRVEAQHVYDTPPFYLLPSLSMRGVPAVRYQGATIVLTETEQRIDFNRRWSMVVFGGLGKAMMPDQDFGDTELVYNYGGGFRYLMARAFGIRAGIDVAMGPDSFGWYIVFGHNWNRL